MKLNQLRTVIREEVRAAVKEELQDMLNEAVKVASTPIEHSNHKTSQSIKESILTGTRTTKSKKGSLDPISEALNQTRATMSPEEYKNIFTGTADMVSKPNFASSMANQMGIGSNSGQHPGLDISKFDFVKKAGQVYKASIEKDKQKHGFA